MSGTDLEPTARYCKGTKQDGTPCRSKLVGPDGYCVVHSPSRRFDPAEAGRAGGLASGEARRAASTSARERLRRLADEDQEVWALVRAAFVDGMEAELPAVTITQKDGTIVEKGGGPDLPTRIRAAQAFLEQGYGRPPQAIVGDEDQPLQIILRSAFQSAPDADEDER